ncbi:MAG: hypothetical protein E7631_13040 [Ruminococcaceae bacterium]|nr:hypothetical protein [Oscillospiraceae bacterium]
MFSSVQNYGGVPTLHINGQPVPGFAYITYRTYNARYDDFAALGCRLFSMPVFFGTQTINETSQIPPMAPGIFENEEPDFTLFDADVEKILAARPDAWIFPRVNMSLPKKWEDEHPDDCCDFGYTERRRACFSSDAWAEETKRLLGIFIDHVEKAAYREHIVGYQLAGGNTEEWFPFDMKGSIGKRSREAFAVYCAEKQLSGTEEELRAFYSEMIARRILEFSAFTKEKTERRLVVGCFYGYTLECPSYTSGHHALRRILASEDVDFICSPVTYAELRPVGVDHACMLPVDSLKYHGKLYFAENDTRTHLSKAPNELPRYNTPIWFGPEPEKTCEIIRMHFSRALLHGHAMWWFDMWGGWYTDDRYRALLGKCREICENALEADRASMAETAVFIDERAYAKDGATAALPYTIRKTLGYLGTPYDIYLIDDYPAVRDKYKAFIFINPVETNRTAKAIADAGSRGMAISPAEISIAPEAIRTFCMEQGVHIWCERDAVVYGCGSYLFLHTKEEGEHILQIPEGITLTDCFTGQLCTGTIDAAAGTGYLFRMDKQV